jgi:parallel beta-helix repeat protein
MPGDNNGGIAYNGNDLDFNFSIWNNTIYGFSNTNSTGIYIAALFDGVFLYNNTVYGCYNGIHNDGNKNPVLKNNLVFGSQILDYSENADFHDDSSNNIGEDADFGNGTGYIQTTQTASEIFVNPVGDNFHILSTSDAYNSGNNLSSDTNLSFNIDIDDSNRGDFWDIGSDEYE